MSLEANAKVANRDPSTDAPPSDAAGAHRVDGRMLGTFSIAAMGGALEFYDFIIFVFLAKTIGQVFFPPAMPAWIKQTEVFGLFAAGYLARPLGGLVMSHMGDRSGRKRMFLVSVLMMALPTLLIGLLPAYDRIGYGAPLLLLACRILQGAAIGGEIPGAWVYVAEHAPPERTGLACGLLTAGLTSGILLGAVVNGMLNALWSHVEIVAYAWRYTFILGGALGLLAVLLRRRLAETPVFEAMRREARLADELPVRTVLGKHAGAVVTSMMATWLLAAVIVVVILMAPLLTAESIGADDRRVADLGMAASAALTVGCLTCGPLIDAMGVRRSLWLWIPMVVASSYLLFGSASPTYVLPTFVVAGFAAGAICIVPVIMVRAFPAAVAFSGVSLSYNVAYAIAGGLTPPLVSALRDMGSLAPAHYIAFVCVISMGRVLMTGTRRRPGAKGARGIVPAPHDARRLET